MENKKESLRDIGESQVVGDQNKRSRERRGNVAQSRLGSESEDGGT